MKKIFKWIFGLVIISLIIAASIFGVRALRLYLAYTGKIDFNPPTEEEFPVRGVDVSYYQGTINWKNMQNAGVDFAFIKATEGMDYVDPCFDFNWSEVASTSIYAGAYHYFSFGTDGKSQADNFISHVAKDAYTLPPVLDFELTDEDTSIDKNTIRTEITTILETFEEYYGVKPIIYTTPKAYMKYLIFGYSEYTMWMRNTYIEPSINWSFWQYDDEGKLDGCYEGDQTYIDLDVYNGSIDDFLKEFNLPRKNGI